MFERYIESLVVACVNPFISQIIEQGRRVQKLLNFNLTLVIGRLDCNISIMNIWIVQRVKERVMLGSRATDLQQL